MFYRMVMNVFAWIVTLLFLVWLIFFIKGL